MARTAHEFVDQRRDILAAIAQRRHRDDERAETEVQIFAERARCDRGSKIAVGRGHDARVDLDRAFGANPADLALLQRSQELRLHGRRNFADFVEEERAVACHLEQARLVAVAPVNAPRTWPKSSDSSSVSVSAAQLMRHERAAGARALIVDHPDDELLAGAALAVDQDRRIDRRHARRELEHLLHRRAAAQ